MKITSNNLTRFFGATLVCVLWVGLDSCNKVQEPVSPFSSNMGARSASSTYDDPIDHGCDPITQIYDPSTGTCVERTDGNNCNAVSYDIQYSWKRNTAIAQFGQNGGSLFDQFASENVNPFVAMNTAGVGSYYSLIANAIISASNAYVSSTSSGDAYNSSTFLSYLNNALNSVKTSINNDGSLSSTQRSVLIEAINSSINRFQDISDTAEANLDCFPNPSGLQTQRANLGKGQVAQRSWFGNFLKKVVNVIATVLVESVVYAVRGAIEGAGLLIGTVFLLPVGIAGGAALGAIYGNVKGIIDAANGNYICVFQGVGNCITP